MIRAFQQAVAGKLPEVTYQTSKETLKKFKTGGPKITASKTSTVRASTNGFEQDGAHRLSNSEYY